MAREYDAQAADRSFRRELRQLTDEVATLRRQLTATDDVPDELAKIRSQQRQTAGDLAEVTDTTLPAVDRKADRAAAAAATVEERLAGVLGQVRQLAAKVAHLEHQLRRADGVEEYALDDVPTEVVALALAADAGRRARAGSLPAPDREAFEAAVGRAVAGEAEWRAAVDAVLTASQALAAAPPDHPTTSWPEVVRRYRRAGEGLAVLRQEARRAQAALDDDTERRQATAATVTTGDAALVRARAALRARIADAVTDRRLLPQWFTDRLGLPHGGSQGWIDLATDVLLYRVTYQVDDPLEALGMLPHDAPAYRRDWHFRLGRELADLVPPG